MKNILSEGGIDGAVEVFGWGKDFDAAFEAGQEFASDVLSEYGTHYRLRDGDKISCIDEAEVEDAIKAIAEKDMSHLSLVRAVIAKQVMVQGLREYFWEHAND